MPATVGRRRLLAGAACAGVSLVVDGSTAPAEGHEGVAPLRLLAESSGLVFGSSTATWQLDRDYRHLHAHQAGLLLTEDDLLWYRLKPSADAPLDFLRGDRVVRFAERHHQLTIGAHLVWDEGFGDGWSDSELRSLTRGDARRLLYGVVASEVDHYRGRMSGWIVANEVTDPRARDRHGLRTTVPWYDTIGPEYVAEAFHLVHEHDHQALRILNEFGFETVDQRGAPPAPRRRAFLEALDHLVERDVPVQAVGIQGHLLADGFASSFDECGYREFLRQVAARGVHILITELDVLDDGLPRGAGRRDEQVADVYRRYLDVTLDEPAVKVLSAFGLTDRYTWLEEDQPRDDGAHRRPLAFDRQLRPKPAYDAISHALREAPNREPLWPPL